MPEKYSLKKPKPPNSDLEDWMGVSQGTLNYWQSLPHQDVVTLGAKKMGKRMGKKARKAGAQDPALPSTWVDQNKKPVRLIQMSVSHLSNALIYIDKRIRTLERYKEAMNKELETRQLSAETRALILEKKLASRPPSPPRGPVRHFRQEDSDEV